MNTNIPLYRAKKIDNDECVVGYFDLALLGGVIHTSNGSHFIINPSTLSIHFPNMLAQDSNRLLPNGDKDLRIFASLSEDGKGGDIVEGLCRDCNGDNITLLHKPANFRGIVRFYGETSMSVVIETEDDILVRDGLSPWVARRSEVLRWSDCRQNIKITGIKQ